MVAAQCIGGIDCGFSIPAAALRPHCQGMKLRAPTRDALLPSLALAALALGVLVYLTDRDGRAAWLLPRVGALGDVHWFGALAAWLPSALHVFAFALLSAALLPAHAGARFAACAAWAAIDLAFEAGQHPALSPGLAAWLEGSLPAWLAQPLAHYFLRGTFDPADAAALLLGALAAAGVVAATSRNKELRHAP